VTQTVLHVPLPAADRLGQSVEDRWEDLSPVKEASDIAFMRRRGELGNLAGYGDEELWQASERRRQGAEPGDDDVKAPEWRVLANPTQAPNGPDFQLTEVEPPKSWSSWITRVVLAERLREVTALTHFTRISSPRDLAQSETLPPRRLAPISRTPPKRVPACEVRGEGLFLQLDEDRIRAWERTVGESESAFWSAHTAWRRQRSIEPMDGNFPGMRFVLLHSLAHALMRQLSIECGYTAASLRERIYSRGADEGDPMAGILIYTAAPDSEERWEGWFGRVTRGSWIGTFIRPWLR